MIVLFNPLSTTPGKQPLPLSVMSLAAVLEARGDEWALVDGNVTANPAAEIIERLSGVPQSRTPLLGVTVMPGPQLTNAVAVCRRVKLALPHVPIVWGGYFPTQHARTVLEAPFVDFVVRAQGEHALTALVDVLRAGGILNKVPGLSWRSTGASPSPGRAAGMIEIVDNPVQPLASLDDLPELPYHRVDMSRYIHANYLGRRTVAHNSSFGCPFACSFCAVVAMSNRRWVAQSPERMERTLRHLATTYRVDAVQMHDMDFFISEPRVAEFAERIADLGLTWWALGRIDVLMHYSDATWRKMKRSGLKMIFSGAEAATDAALARMNKGGTAAASLTLELARRMREHDIVPEFSFVLGSPPNPIEDVDATFEFIRKVKRINPATEIILYTYTPVPLDGVLYDEARRRGFEFPSTLDQWASASSQQLALRRGEGLPWIDARVRKRIRNFERVVNAYYPTTTDTRLTAWHRAALKMASSLRYALKWYSAPYELRALQRLIQYQRPETTGF
ncbi:MAG TPA: radical SAM protein [Vicinamibacterales bacterium]|nr:radical SAM protein [Vicinamibacterales bacterium]